MNKIIGRIAKNAASFPQRIALRSQDCEISYQELLQKIDEIADYLRRESHKMAAIMASNCCEWIIFDLACLKAEVCFVAIPHFFSEEQISSLINSAAPTIILYDNSVYGTFFEACQDKSEFFGFKGFFAAKNPKNNKKSVKIDEKCAKITFTSGSTGNPKGVCLSRSQIENVVFSLEKRVEIENIANNLSILPLSILLENIAGVYLTIVCGGCAIILNEKEIGFEKSSKIDFEQFAKALAKYDPTSFILVPEIAKILILLVKNGKVSPKNWKFIAVGGAKVAKSLIEETLSLKMPLYQGYGLSEFSSVVALNCVKENKFGSVGKVLPHINIKIAEDGEILLKNNAFLGYLGEEKFLDEWYQTGDIGEVDADGFLWIMGRKKNIFITSFGRNINPEWLESEFLHSEKILQIAIFGEAQSFNTAIIFSNLNEKELQKEVAKINKNLPDYAQVEKIISVKEPFSAKNEMLTQNGRLRRDNISQLLGIPAMRGGACAP